MKKRFTLMMMVLCILMSIPLKMMAETVVGEEKGVAVGNYYLVGNFFTDDGDNINRDKKYFRFINNKGDGNLYFDIPASLTVKAQVYGADGKCYGPKDNKEIGIE